MCLLRHTGWRRPIGCLKLQIIFRKRATNYRALLRNMSYTDKTSCESSPPCMQFRDGTASLAIYGRRTRHCLILSEFAILCFVFLHTHTHTQKMYSQNRPFHILSSASGYLWSQNKALPHSFRICAYTHTTHPHTQPRTKGPPHTKLTE